MYEDEEINGIFYNPFVLCDDGVIKRCPHFGKISMNDLKCVDKTKLGCRFCVHRDDEKHTKWNMRFELWKLGYGKKDANKLLSFSALFNNKEIVQLIDAGKITFSELGLPEPSVVSEKSIGLF